MCVDDDDAHHVTPYRWSLTEGYALRRDAQGRSVLLHRQLLDLEPGDPRQGDHVNGDRLNNSRSNLRITTRSGNQQNRHYGYGSSQYRGVSWDRTRDKWMAGAVVGGKRQMLGRFESEEEAAAVAAAFRAEHMPMSPEARAA
jgi:hypothetical protein